jgi:hypothetical protein
MIIKIAAICKSSVIRNAMAIKLTETGRRMVYLQDWFISSKTRPGNEDEQSYILNLSIVGETWNYFARVYMM